MQKLLLAIKAVFPDADTSTLNSNTTMAQIPGWDSMNAVNLLLEIEATFGCTNLSLEFSDHQTLGEVCDQLRSSGLPV